MTRRKMISQKLCENIVDEAQIRLIAKSHRTHFKRWVSLSVSCVLAISIGLGAFFILAPNSVSKSNSSSSVKMFSDGILLYFIDIRKNNKLYSYHPVSAEIKVVINEPVYEVYIKDKNYFYSCKSGFYSQNCETGEKYRIIEYGKEISCRLKELDGSKLFDTPAQESSGSFFEHNGSLYFVYGAEVDLMIDEHIGIGKEKWITLYRFDIETRILTAIKNDYHIWGIPAPPNPPKGNPHYDPDYSESVRYKDISLSNLNIANEKIYYQNASDIHSLSLDGKNDEIICSVPGIIRIDWKKSVIDYIEYIDLDLTSPVPFSEQNTGCFFNTISFDGKKISSYKMSGKNHYRYDTVNMYYDSQKEAYIDLRDDELIRFSFDKPEEYTSVAKVGILKNMNMINIIRINESIFISACDSVLPAKGRNKNYCVMEITETGELTVVIKNGKSVP